MTASRPMTLVIDEHIPPAIVAYLAARGHVIHLVAESTIKGEADEVVCALADQLHGIVVTFNHRHYARLLARTPQTGSVRFPRAGRISFTCPPHEALARLEAVIEDIEEEFAKGQSRADSRLLVTIERIRFSFERCCAIAHRALVAGRGSKLPRTRCRFPLTLTCRHPASSP